MEVYLDNNATTQCLPSVIDKMAAVLGPQFGNPSSAHNLGERARRHVSGARETVAQLLNCDASQIMFTSSGTESNNLAIRSAFVKPHVHDVHVVTSVIEHSSVLKQCEWLEENGARVTYVGANREGNVSAEAVAAAICPSTALVSIQWVNNETGVIQPILEIADLCKQKGIPLHTDAAQAVGKLPLNLRKIPVDFLSFTAHKLHGPAGVGVLYARDQALLTPIFHGGGQENGYRAGTENVSGIAGLGEAVHQRQSSFGEANRHISKLRDQFEDLVTQMIPDVEINGGGMRVPNASNLLFHGVDGQALTARLNQMGIYCSQSSACTNMRPEPSYVLRAMGLSEAQAYASIRFGFSVLNTPEEIEYTSDTLDGLVQQLRRFGNYPHSRARVVEE